MILIVVAGFLLATQDQAILYLGRPCDPNLQRWIQRGPIGERGSINLYTKKQSAGIDIHGVNPLTASTPSRSLHGSLAGSTAVPPEIASENSG